MRKRGILATIVLAFALLAVTPALAQIVGPEPPPVLAPTYELQAVEFPNVCEGCLYRRSSIVTQFPHLETMPYPIEDQPNPKAGRVSAQTGYVSVGAPAAPSPYTAEKPGLSGDVGPSLGHGSSSMMSPRGGGSIGSSVMQSERKIRGVIRKLG